MTQTIASILQPGIDATIEKSAAHLNPSSREQRLGPLLATYARSGSGKTLLTLACYADAMRVVHHALLADGEITGEEADYAESFLGTVAECLSKFRQEYVPFVPLKRSKIGAFLKHYEEDSGPFGLQDESTKWSSISVLRNIAEQCDDNAALTQFRATLVHAAEMLLKVDGMSDEEEEFLRTLKTDTGYEESTETANSGSNWFINPGYTMCSLRNGNVQILIQPAVGNLGITTIQADENESVPSGFQAIATDDAARILQALRKAIDGAMQGEPFSLNDIDWSSSNQDESSDDDDWDDDDEDDWDDEEIDENDPECEVDSREDDELVDATPAFDPTGWSLPMTGEVSWQEVTECAGNPRESSLVTLEEWRDAISTSRVVSILHSGDGSIYVGKVGHTVIGEPGNLCRVVFDRSIPPAITITDVDIDDIDVDFDAASRESLTQGEKLLEACRAGDLEAAISAIKRGADLNYEEDESESGKTPLRASIEAGNLALVQMLIEKGLPNDADEFAWARAMVAGYYEIADTLKKHGFQAEPGAALLMACKTGVTKSIPRLVEDLDLNDYYYGDEVYGTPLVVAAEFGQDEAVDALMKLGSAAEQKDSCGISPWAAAVANGHDHTALLLEKSGAKPEINLALVAACNWGNPKMIKVLVARGADVNAQVEMDREQVTPLLKCITASTWLDEEGNKSYWNDEQRLQRESIEFLLQKGANAQWKRNTSRSEYSLLHQAVYSGKSSIIPILVRYGADIETRDSTGDSPLITAIETGNTSEAWGLLKAGADPNAKDKAKNPAMFAMFREFGGYSVECIKILLAFGADINAANAKGWSLRKRCQKAVDDPGQEGGSEENAQALYDFLEDTDACKQVFNLMRDPIETAQDLVNVVEFIRDTINEPAEYLTVIDDFIKINPEDAIHGLTLLASHEEWRIREATLRAIESHFGKELEPKTVMDVITEGSFDDDSDVSGVADRILANNADVVIPILADRFIENPLQAFHAGALLNAFVGKRSEIIPKIQSAIHENPSQTIGIERIKTGHLLSLKAELEAEDSPDDALKSAMLAVALDPSLQRSCWGILAELKHSRNDNSLASALEHYINGSQAEDLDDARNHYEQAVKADPSFLWSYNNIAWQLATAAESTNRNGAKAVEFAKKACELDGYHYWGFLDTLAAAYAESGDFENAVRWQSQAIKNCPDDTSEMASILERYRNQEAYPFSEFEDDDDSKDD